MVFVDSGKNQIRNFLADITPSTPRPAYMALGSVGSPIFTSTDNALRYEPDGSRRGFDSDTGSSLDKQVEFEMILPSTEPSGEMPITLREVELSSGSPANTGSVYSLSTTAGITKTTDVEIQTIAGIRIL